MTHAKDAEHTYASPITPVYPERTSMIDLRTSDCRPAAGHIVHTYLTALRYGTTVTASEATPPRLDCTATIAWGTMPDGSGAEKAVGAGPPGPA
jgi:hypothetical protein